MNRDDPRFLEFCLNNLKVRMFIAEPYVANSQANYLSDAQACAGQEPEQRRENDRAGSCQPAKTQAGKK